VNDETVAVWQAEARRVEIEAKTTPTAKEERRMLEQMALFTA